MNQFLNSALTPRQRQELEPQKLMRTRRPVYVTPIGMTATTLITARPDADYILEAFWVANVTSSDASYNIHIVEGAEALSASNAIAFGVIIPANLTDIVVGTSGVMVPPGLTLVASCSAANAVNMYGHGWDMMGDYQT